MSRLTLPAWWTRRGRDVVRVHRLEYPFPLHYLCHAVVGACYAAVHMGQLAAAPVVLVLIANLLVIIAGNPINAAADLTVDAKTPGKVDISDASRRLGPRALVAITATEMALALGCATLAALWLDRASIVVCSVLAIMLCTAYNLEPIRLKRRGFANPITLALFYGLLPALAGFLSVRPDIPAAAWLILSGLAVVLAGRTLWWSIPDRAGDAEAGIATPAVRYGVRGTLVTTYLATAIGLGLLGWGLWWQHGFGWALLGVAAGAGFLENGLHGQAELSGDASYRQVRRRALLPITIFDVVLVVIPLVS
jgi:4-hydroxybenzoate polyprenyltransferase